MNKNKCFNCKRLIPDSRDACKQCVNDVVAGRSIQDE